MSDDAKPPPDIRRLSRTQRQCLEAYAATGTVAGAAAALAITPRAAEYRLLSGYGRAGVANCRQALYLLGVEHGKRAAKEGG